MSKTKKMPKSLFLGRWRIVSMSTWNEDYINEEFPAFIEFDDKGDGSSQFAYVRGGIDYRIMTEMVSLRLNGRGKEMTTSTT